MPFFVSKLTIALFEDTIARERINRAEAVRRTADLERRVDQLEATNRVLERQNSVHQANTGWLRSHVNQITDERARLLMREVNFFTDPPEIVGMPTAASTSPMKSAADEREERDNVAVAEAISGAGLFEDMGDAAAKALGVQHTADGAVLYQK